MKKTRNTLLEALFVSLLLNVILGARVTPATPTWTNQLRNHNNKYQNRKEPLQSVRDQRLIISSVRT